MTNLKKTPLFDLHEELGGKIVPFAGYALPVQYPDGIMKEHSFCRESAGLFDVSHMGQAFVHGAPGADPAKALEKLMPSALAALGPGKMRYTVLLNDEGGIIDDLIVTRTHDAEGTLFVVVNAATKDIDFDRLEDALGDDIRLEPLEDRALLALQGPKAVDVLADLAPDVKDLYFMEATSVTLEGVVCWVSRAGYTGEDGFEISIPADEAPALARRLLRDDRVKPIGLGARDSLRLEAGLCLSGHDFNETRTPVEANLTFAMQKARREAADFVGANRILAELAAGPKQKLVGIKPDGRAPAREGAEIADDTGSIIGVITSGGFGPTVGGPVALGYVDTAFAAEGSKLTLVVRGKGHLATVVRPPFTPQRYIRRPKG